MYPPSQPPTYGYGPPSFAPPPPPPPKKSGGGLIGGIAIGVVVLAYGGCTVLTGYAKYHASTPEGKREAAAQQAKNGEDVAKAIAKLHAIGANLPAEAETQRELSCPAGTAGLHPVVDSVWLAYVGKPRAEWSKDADLASLAKVRDGAFSDALLAAAETGDAGADGIFGPASDARRVLDAKVIAVLDVDRIAPPEVDGSGFTGGVVHGSVVLMDVATAKPLCHAPLSATSSESVDYGGGVKIKVVGGLGPTVGDKSLAEAVQKDFAGNIKKQMDAAMKRIGAR